MFRKRLPLVFLIFAIAVAALGVTLFMGVNSEQPVLSMKRPSAEVQGPKPKIVVWAVGSIAAGDRMRASLNGWETELSVRVDLRVFPSRVEYETARIVAAQNREMPDVLWVSADEVDALDQTNVILRMPLEEVPQEQYLPQALGPFLRNNNSVLAYPAQYAVTVLYYNRADFDQAGIAYPDTQWNWDSVISIARVLHQPAQNGKPIHYGLEITPTLELWNALSAQAGQPVYRGKSWLLDAPEAAAAQAEGLQFLIDLEQTYTFANPRQPEGRPTFFEQGNAALLIAGSEMRSVLEKNPDLPWGVTALPDRYAMESDRSHRTTPLRVCGWAISGKTTHPVAARKVAEKLATLAFDGWLSAQQSAPLPDNGGAVYAAALATATPPFINPQTSRILSLSNEVFSTLQTGSTNPEKLMAKLRSALGGFKLTAPEEAAAK